jgi:murein L,D-transpeptidase YafK
LFKVIPQGDPCSGQGTKLLATVSNQILYVCENGQSVQNFDFAMGVLGAGKTAEGDYKTPLGTYPLGPAHASKFGLFIPVGYPTAQQRAQGFTGSAIGIHGPNRPFRCGGFLNVSVNWTDGCVALADDSFVTAIAGWLEAHPREATLTIQ